MRFTVILPLCALLAAPAAAQNSAPVTLSAPVTTPIDGWGADSLGGPPRSLSRDFIKAQRLVADGRYVEADSLLNKLIGQTNSRKVRFLKGVTALGLNNPETARRFFERSLPATGYGDPGAMSGLAIAQVQLGNVDAAQRILSSLRDQQRKCGTDCDRAEPLDRAVSIVERILT